MSMAVKKKNLYYISNLAFQRVNIPFQSMLNDAVEKFFFAFIMIELLLNFGDNKLPTLDSVQALKH